MKRILPVFLLLVLAVPEAPARQTQPAQVIAEGHLPDLAGDASGQVYLAYGKGDSILVTRSRDGSQFQPPVLAGRLPHLMAYAMRGPQIAVTAHGLVITACTKDGDIYAYRQEGGGVWKRVTRLNTRPQQAREALMALGAYGKKVYAVWLGVKPVQGQDLYGAWSDDEGRTWSQPVRVYTSPSGTVCECCKPSVLVQSSGLTVMFRNWLSGNRDMYLVRSSDGGKTFSPARKLGQGSWPLNGCPMDGGALTGSPTGALKSIWQRAGHLYQAGPGEPERVLGEGRHGAVLFTPVGYVYAWERQGQVILHDATGNEQVLGVGALPQLARLSGNRILCVWEQAGKIIATVPSLTSPRIL